MGGIYDRGLLGGCHAQRYSFLDKIRSAIEFVLFSRMECEAFSYLSIKSFMKLQSALLPIGLLLLFIYACQLPESKGSAVHSGSQVPDTLQEVWEVTAVDPVPKNEIPDYSAAQKDSIVAYYERLIKQVAAKRKTLASAYSNAASESERTHILQETQSYFTEQLTSHLLPCWYGTPWDFNGHINRPHRGEIACGYFVSTPLRHMGFQLNRYRLAQQASATIVNKLCHAQKRFTSVEATLEYLRNQPDDLYIVGLDYHVGFLHTSGGEIRFLHSTYIDPTCAMTEKAEDSWVLRSSGLYVIGHLASNHQLMKDWLLANEIQVE